MGRLTTVQKSLIDGVIRGLLIYILGEFLISAYVDISPLLTGAVLALCILIPVVVLALFVGKETFNASIGGYLLMSFLFLLITLFGVSLNYMTVKIKVFPLGQIGDVNGIFMILVMGGACIVTSILRGIVGMYFIIRNSMGRK